MKIAIIISSLSGGGAERVAITLNRYFNQNMTDQVDCDLIILNKTGDYQIDEKAIFLNENYSQNPVKKAAYHFFLYQHKLKQIKEGKHYDAVISFSSLSNLLNIKSKMKEKVIISVRNYLSLMYSQTELEKLRKEYVKSDRIIAVSEQCRYDLIDSLKMSPESIETIYNPYLITHIQKEGAKPVATQDDWLFTGGNTVISAGRFSDQKAFWRLIKAVAILKVKIPDVHLVLMGKEKRGNKNHHLLEKLIKKYDLSRNVFLVGFKENPYAYIQKSCLFVLCSQYEGFPNAMTEAMCLGVPVVSVDCLSGPREILAPELHLSAPLAEPLKATYGILVPQYPQPENRIELTDNDHLLAEEIQQVLLNQEMRHHYGTRAKDRAREFEAGIIAHKWIDQLESIL